jgi:hypothetical protein
MGRSDDHRIAAFVLSMLPMRDVVSARLSFIEGIEPRD